MNLNIEKQLEEYTLKKLDEVLLVEIETEEETGTIIIFKGFSSSLTGSTNSNPDEPIIPAKAKIIKIDRLISPYNPNNLQYIQKNLSWEDMKKLMIEL
jgi:hypothetical protein